MPTPTIYKLWEDPRYRALSPGAQMEVANQYLLPELMADPRFTSMSLGAQELVKKRRILEAVTFDGYGNFGEFARNLMMERLADPNAGSAKKALTEGAFGLMQNSGIASAISQLIEGEDAAKERRRVLDFLRAAGNVTDDTSSFEAVGSLIGNLGDIFAVNAVMSPITSAARGAVSLAARGGKAVAAAAKAQGITAPLLHPMLEMVGGVAAESAIEAIPYFLLEEQKRAANGQESAISKGPLEVAKVLGVNAAADFLVGTVMQGFLLKGAKVLFGPSDIYQSAFKSASEQEKIISELRTGRVDESILERLDPIQRDAIRQRISIDKFLKDGVADPEAQHWTRDAFLAHDMGKVVGRSDDGTYRVWSLQKNGRPVAKTYTNITDMENFLSYEAYNQYLKMPTEIQDKFLRTHTAWALPRGKVLWEQQALLGGSEILEADKALVAGFKKLDKQIPLSARPVITNGEAQALSRLSGGEQTVIQAKMPLSGTIVENINKAEMNLLKGSHSVRVTPSDAPNVLLIGKKAAPPELYEQMTVTAQRAILADPKITLEQSRASNLLNMGFDHFRHADGSVEFFAPRNMKLIGTPDDILTPYAKPTVSGQASPLAIVTETRQFAGAGRTITGNEDLALSAAVKAMRSGTPEDMTNFAKLYASGRGENLNVILKQSDSLSLPKVTRAGDDLTIVLPKKAVDYMTERKYVQKILEGLDGATTVGPSAKSADYWASKFTKKVQAFEIPGNVNKTEWVSNIAKQFGGRVEALAGKVGIKMPSGASFIGSEDDALTWLVRRVGDEVTIIDDLRSQGIRIARTGTGVRALSLRTNKLIDSAENLPDLLDKLEYVPNQLDLAFGPKVINITPDGIEFSITGNQVYRDPNAAFNALSKFRDSRTIAGKKVLTSDNVGELRAVDGGSYEVYLGEFGATRSFESLTEARDFLRRGTDPDIEELRAMAANKYADLSIENGQYVLRSGPKTFRLDTLDDLKAKMKEIPDLEDSVPSILDDLDPTIEASVKDLVNQFKAARRKYRAGPNPYGLPPEFEFKGNVKEAGIYDTGRKMFANFTSWIEGVAERTNNPGLAKQMHKFRDVYRIAQGETVAANRYLDTIIRTSSGKIPSIESRRKIFYHMGTTTEADAAVFNKQYLDRYGKALTPLTADEQRIAGELNKFLDSLSIKFGIQYKDLITKYMPRLRDLASAENAELLNELTTVDELVGRVWKGTPPKELKFWAENARIEDVTRFFLKDDALEVLMMYTAQGNKKFYLNEPWKQMQRYMIESKVEPSIVHRVDMYRENLMSSYHSHGEKAIEDFGAVLGRELARSKLGKTLGFNEAQLTEMGRHIMQSTMSLTYFSTMGWKPFLAIRNAMQPLTMTAPRVGMSWTLRAYKEVLDNPKLYMEKYRARNVLSEKPPIVNQIMGHETKMGRIVEKSLESFKNSDDMTRAVAMRAAELRFENATNAWKLGQIKTREAFFDMSGLDVVDPTTAEEAWKMFSRGDDIGMQSASDLYAFKVQRDSMFDYSGTDTPGAFQGGVMGKLFGQFGTYSAGYRANMANMFKYGPVHKRAQMVATYLAATGALYASFNAMRIKTNDFIPFAPAIFTGGPMFDIAINGVKALDPGFEGEKARAQLKQDLGSIAPGSSQYRALKKFSEYSEAGDSYAATLSLMMTPVRPLW